MSDYQYTRILQAVTEMPWAILPSKLTAIREMLAIRASGQQLSAEDVAGAMNGRSGERVQSAGNTAVLSLVGTIVPRGNMFTEASGAVSVQRFTNAFRAALRDPDVGAILIDVDSPGGQVGGVEELSSEIFQARGQKPITAVVNTLAASAAYWVASAADEMVISPSGQAGSIGVFAMHQDVSAYLESEGVKPTLISAGKYKTEGNPFEPLTDEARGAIQEMVDDYYNMFTRAVARNRGVSPDAVRSGFGEGRVVSAEKAVALGMADRVSSFSEVISEQAGRSPRRSAFATYRHKLQIERMKGDNYV